MVFVGKIVMLTFSDTEEKAVEKVIAALADMIPLEAIQPQQSPATSLIFNAKGNPFGQFLMVIFSILYGAISFAFAYYGEMITYLGMTAPMVGAKLPQAEETKRRTAGTGKAEDGCK